MVTAEAANLRPNSVTVDLMLYLVFGVDPLISEIMKKSTDEGIVLSYPTSNSSLERSESQVGIGAPAASGLSSSAKAT